MTSTSKMKRRWGGERSVVHGQFPRAGTLLLCGSAAALLLLCATATKAAAGALLWYCVAITEITIIAGKEQDDAPNPSYCIEDMQSPRPSPLCPSLYSNAITVVWCCQGMEQRWGVAPNVYHYTSLVTCLLKAGQWSEAIAMTDKMEVGTLAMRNVHVLM